MSTEMRRRHGQLMVLDVLREASKRGPPCGSQDRAEPLARPTRRDREGRPMSRLRRAAVALAVIGLLAFGAPGALADGNGAFTDTQNFHNVTETFPADSMCGSPVGTVTV